MIPDTALPRDAAPRLLTTIPMSEYQYYEFAAADAPLTREQQAALRACSSRATITASSFRNEYHWGDLKADPRDWMKRYFDAHVYSAGWAACSLMLRLPRTALDEETLAGFAASGGGAFSVHATTRHWILDWSFSDDSGECERFYDEQDGPGWMARLLPLREELLRGDLRPLYLGWLARLCSCELDDDELEPPVPRGLDALSPAQTALADFLELDPDLLAVAAAGSAPLAPRQDARRAAQAWADQLPAAELRDAVVQLVTGQGRELERRLGLQHAEWLDGRAGAPQVRRTVAQIEAGRGAAEQARLEKERAARAAREARLHAERVSRLAKVAAQAEAIWAQLDLTLQGGTGTAYGQAIAAASELAQALAAEGRGEEFRRGLARLQESHGSRPAWVKRLKQAGLL